MAEDLEGAAGGHLDRFQRGAGGAEDPADQIEVGGKLRVSSLFSSSLLSSLGLSE